MVMERTLCVPFLIWFLICFVICFLIWQGRGAQTLARTV